MQKFIYEGLSVGDLRNLLKHYLSLIKLWYLVYDFNYFGEI